MADHTARHHAHPRKLVLCFDGTGNKFRGDDSDSNILKIFRMLDRTAEDQYHYYQPGMGTYTVSGDLSHTSLKKRMRSWYLKAKDSAFGSSFDQHVVGGYRFLMRFYNPGDEIYIFGFSRGAYIARFLAEMLDYVGLLSHGNEEMVHFAWKSFSQWQCRRQDGSDAGEAKRKEMYAFMKGFRETFSRPVRRIQFLGLFDTVNSVPRFEAAWMERSKFPYTARSSARVIRHAVSLDERRAKFRQDLVYQSTGAPADKHHHHHHHHARDLLHNVHEKLSARRHSVQAAIALAALPQDAASTRPSDGDARRDRRLSRLPDGNGHANEPGADQEDPAPYRAPDRPVSRAPSLAMDDVSEFSHGAPSGHHGDDSGAEQDLVEVWFSGDHADTGGGWEITPGTKSYSHVPLTWMVREAMRAGLVFDAQKVVAMGCSDALEHQWAPKPSQPPEQAPAFRDPFRSGDAPPTIRINDDDASADSPTGTSKESDAAAAAAAAAAANIALRLGTPPSAFGEMMRKAELAPTHDCLDFHRGLAAGAVLAWKAMEYLPFRRMDLQPDGSWRPIRWPLPCGEVRDIPDNVLVHGSVLRRMQHDPAYRPGNLIIGGGGRGTRVAAAHHGMGEWDCVAEQGDLIGELWTKRKREGPKGEVVCSAC